MTLQNLYEITKQDQYTADGRAAVEDARRTYEIGEISEATGLQKTANGWVKPSQGKGTPKEKAAGLNLKQRQTLNKLQRAPGYEERMAYLKGNKAGTTSSEKIKNLKPGASTYIMQGAPGRTPEQKFAFALDVELDERFGDTDGDPDHIRDYVENWLDRTKDAGGIGFKETHGADKHSDVLSPSDIDSLTKNTDVINRIVKKWEKFYRQFK